MKRIYYFTIFFCILYSFTLTAQNSERLWTGLLEAQSAAELPTSHADPVYPERKPFIESRLLFSKDALRGDREAWILKNWVLIDNPTLQESGLDLNDPDFEQRIIQSPYADRIYNATVPGTILGTLVDRGIYPHPYFGLNNMCIPDSLARTDWWYRTTVNIARLNEEEQILLSLEGINYRSDIFLNGKKIGNSLGAFCRTEIEIQDYLSDQSNENILTVHVFPPYHPGIPHEQSMRAGQGLNGGILSLDGPTFISSVGWDWMPGIRDRNMGIWQEAHIRRYHSIKTGDVQIISDLPLPNTDHADLYINLPVKNLSSEEQKFELELEIRNHGVSTEHKTRIRLNRSITLTAHSEQTLCFSPATDTALSISDPLLWWPNGYGEPNLYELHIHTITKAGETFSKPILFGIRELSYELSTGASCRRIEFRPCDRISSSRNKGEMRFSFAPNFDNEERHLYTSSDQKAYTPEFYLSTLKEEAGIYDLAEDAGSPYLVLRVNGQRIFCRGGNWGMDDAMKRKDDTALENAVALHAEAGFNIIRNWTGESTQENFYAMCDRYGMLVWNDFWITTDDTVGPEDAELFLKNARETVLRYRNHPSIVLWCPRNEGFAPKELEGPLNRMINELDPTRLYHGQSRLLNMGTSGPWGYQKEAAWYFDRRAEGFNTEMGSFAIPTALTLRKFIAPQDYWPINDVWAYHDLHHTTQNFEEFMEAVHALGEPKSMSDFSRKAQFRCYDAWRAMMEAWNHRIWDNTTGLILWMSHPAWPSMIWQTYTYDFETPGSYYGAKKACEMMHIQMHPSTKEISVIDVNAQMAGKYKVLAEIYGADGRKLGVCRKNLKIKEKGFRHSCMNLPLKKLPEADPFFIRLKLLDADGELISINEYWHYGSIVEKAGLGEVRCETLAELTAEGRFRIQVTNTSKHVLSGIKLNALEPETRQIILPALISDSYFSLLPGESRVITSSEEMLICTDAAVIL